MTDEVQRLRAQLADAAATEAVLRGEIRRTEAALAAFEAVVAERNLLAAQLANLAPSPTTAPVLFGGASEQGVAS